MENCEDCKEYQAESDGLCPICNWRDKCEDFGRQSAYLELIIEDSLPTEVKIKSIQDTYNILIRFYKCNPPERATPIGTNEEEDVSDVTARIKEIAWDSACSPIRVDIVKIYKIKPHLRDDEILRNLLNLSYKSIHERFLMVSVVNYYITSYIERSLKFTKVNKININKVDLEITGGYYSYARGDDRAHSDWASVFKGLPNYNFSEDFLYQRDDLIFANSKIGNGTSLNLIGPEDKLQSLVISILQDPSAYIHLGSFTGDLKIAYLWWKDKRNIRDFFTSEKMGRWRDRD